MSYDLASKLGHELHRANFQVVICDEAHYLKNDKAKRTEMIVPILQKATRAFLLTGIFLFCFLFCDFCILVPVII